jgi:hypothetical protein
MGQPRLCGGNLELQVTATAGGNRASATDDASGCTSTAATATATAAARSANRRDAATTAAATIAAP